ncbi:MAG: hypothetical protein ACYC0X_28890 [Pirellulaceae bacterium]
MGDFLIGLLVAAFVCTLITLCGHGMWLLVAATLRTVFGIGSKALGAASHCPRCGHPAGLQNGVCEYCGFETVLARRRGLSSTRRLIQQLRQQERLDPVTYEYALKALVDAESSLPSSASLAATPLEPMASSAAAQRMRPPRTGPAAVEAAPVRRPMPIERSPAVDAAEDPLDAEIIFEDGMSDAGHRVAGTPVPPAVPDFARDVASTPPPFSSRRTLADMLQSFMEEKNIRWGELASGMLIVGSAIGLVISLRATLAEISERIRYFPALLFMLGTLTIHAAGLYTLRRWKLRSTSRGVLIIATLLVPLSFAAGIVLSGSEAVEVPVTSPLYLLAVVVGVVGYGAITALSARSLFAEGWWRLVVVVVGASIGQLIVNRWGNVESARTSMLAASALFGLPLASFLVATLGQLQQVAKRPRLTPARALQTFTVLGISIFSLLVTLGLLVFVGGSIRATLTVLSPCLSVVAAVVMGTGIAIHRRCTAQQLAETRTAGTALGIFGGMLMLGALVLAWPTPGILIAVSLVTAVAFAVLARLGQVPVLHAGAVLAATFAYLLVFLRLSVPWTNDGALRAEELISALVMGRSALALTVAVGVVAAIGGWLLRSPRRRSDLAWTYLATAAAIAAVSAAVGLYAGFWSGVDGDWMTLLFAAYALASLPLSGRWLRPWMTWLGSGLALVTLFHLLGWNHWFADRLAVWNLTFSDRLWLALLTHGFLMELVALGCGLGRRLADKRQAVASSKSLFFSGLLEPLCTAGAITSTLAVAHVLAVGPQTLGRHATYAVIVAVAWAIAGSVGRLPRLVGASYIAATVAIGFFVAAVAVRQPWPQPVLGDLRHLQWQVVVLGLWCALTTTLCQLSRRHPATWHHLREISPAIDRILLGALIVTLVGVGILACGPGVLVELGTLEPTSSLAQDPWHVQAYHFESWLALVSVMLALAVALTQRATRAGMVGAVALTAVIPLLIAGRWESAQSVASASRWGFAIYTLCWTALIVMGHTIARGGHRLWKTLGKPQATLGNAARNASMGIGTCTVLGLTWLSLVQVSLGTWVGPLKGTWFAQLSPIVSCSVPLAILITAFLVIAVWEGSVVFAFLGALVTECLIVTCVDVHAVGAGMGRSFDWSVAMLQWTAVGLGGYGLIWLGLSRWIDRQTPSSQRWLRMLAVSIPGAAVIWLSTWALSIVFLNPAAGTADFGHLGHWLTYAAAGLAAAGLAWHARRDAVERTAVAIGLLIVLVPVVAATAGEAAMRHPWLSYHVLTGTWLGIGLAAAGLVAWRTAVGDRAAWLVPVRTGAALVGSAVLVLAMRGCLIDPLRPDWTAGACGGLFLLWAVLGIEGRSQWHAWASVTSVIFAAWTLWWEESSKRGVEFIIGGTGAIVVGSVTAALFWLVVEVWFQRKHDTSFDPRLGRPRIHTFVAVTTTIVLGLVIVGGAAISTVTRLAGRPTSLSVSEVWSVAALLSLGVLLSATLWDRYSKLSLVAMYGWGWIAIALGLNYLERIQTQGAELTVVAACLAGAAYIALTGHLWRWGAHLVRGANRWQIPEPIAKLEHTAQWLPGVNVLGTLFICFLGFVTLFVSEERPLRMGVAFAPLLLAYGVGCLGQQQRRLTMQCLALLVASLAAVYIGWADVQIDAGQEAVLTYAARLLVCLAGMTLLYAVVVARWMGPEGGWYEAVRRSSLVLAAMTVSTLVVVLGLEVLYFKPGVGAPIAGPEVIAISVMLFGFIVALFSMALWPGRDPLNLTDKGRTAYVYAAQFVAAVLFAHVYLAEPQLFGSELFRRYWPYIVMLLAFGSGAFGEMCTRREWRVIAEPLLRTGGFLPLIPALAAWAFSETSYPLVLFFAGLVYLFFALTRRSFVAGIAAAVMGNGALWALLTDQGFVLRAQPQFWLIPPAVSVLVAAHINRAQLSDAALTSVRYICVMIIYLSSAGEMFMKLVVPGDEDWLRPIILASLAVSGIFAGILLQVRAFLYLGASFLLLSIVAMVWNAGRLVQHTWPWWLFGITLGLAILVLFGVFEKHRRDVQLLIARLRQWDA